ncbi:hypothetical protein V6N13_064102 [Hibiscus sabdariffa]|uniref:MULE transposase domain-containing protein n=1 Tax=Hibiscus sabdariffa TaxID=183260 RepID=A0ABR2ALY3_9ROSI
MTLERYNNVDNGPNGPLGIDGLVGEDNYDTQKDSGQLGRGAREVNEDCGDVGFGAADRNEECGGLGSTKGNKANIQSLGRTVGLSLVDENKDELEEGTFDLMVIRPTPVENPKFGRLYVCFSALNDCFKKYCKAVIGLDVCYLKSAFKGEILSVVGRDNNNQIFSIVWAVVEVKNRETWPWFCSKVISIVWCYCNERLRRSYRVSEVVKGAGWKRMKVGWRTVFRFGRLSVGGFSGRSGQNGLYSGPGQNGSTSVDAHTVQFFGVFGSHKKGMALKGIRTTGSMGGKVMSNTVFQLLFLIVRVSTDVVHRLVVGKAVSDASLPDKVYTAGDALRGNVQNPLKVWIYARDKIVLGLFVLFLDLWCAGFSIETIHISLDWIQFPWDIASIWFCRFLPYLNSINLAKPQGLDPTMILPFATIHWDSTFIWFWLFPLYGHDDCTYAEMDGWHGFMDSKEPSTPSYHCDTVDSVKVDDHDKDHPQGE